MSRFPRITPRLLSPLIAIAVVTLGACSSAKPKFTDDQLLSSAPNQFSRNFSYTSAEACEASRRALLSQGYMTTMTHNDTVDATKDFQPESDSHIAVEVHVVCTDADAANTSVVYVNAVQSGYALKKSDTSASVGLSILGSVSLPIRSNSDSMVKISSETIQSKAFYNRFFELISRYLGTAARSEAVPNTDVIKITPLPPVVLPAVATTAPLSASATAATSAMVPQQVTVPGAPMPVLQPVVPPATVTPAAATHVSATAPAAPAATPAATPAAASSATVASATIAAAPAASSSSSAATGTAAAVHTNATTTAAPSATTPATP